jgi:glycerol-3-phosphate acyltransferase
VKARGIASHSSPCGSLHHCLSHSSPCSSSACGRTMAPTKPSPPPPPLDKLHGKTLVVDVEGWILRPPMSAFPYFMLVAVEAGGFLRGLLLLLLCPLLSLLGDGARTRAMATVALVGLEEKEVVRVGRAVLPKFFLEAAAAEGVAAVQAAASVVAVSVTFPTVMLDGFLREYRRGRRCRAGGEIGRRRPRRADGRG